MKLIVQIPCHNEAETLAATLRDIPVQVPGFDNVEVMVIDDGSTDDTVQRARDLGVPHILGLGSHRGLAKAFNRGLERALELGADVVVNTDGDNQYCGADIPRLVEPILANRADMVIGCQPIHDHPDFGPLKTALQRLGSWALRRISRTSIRDAASGFRAFSRETCQRLFVFSQFSYCMETLIQAGSMGLRVASVDVRVNPATRPSRLHRGIFDYLYRSGATILTMFIYYRPGRFFLSIGSPFILLALALGARYLYLRTLPGDHGTFVPSLIALAISALTGFLLFAMGVLGEISKTQRMLAQEILFLQRKRAPAATPPETP